MTTTSDAEPGAKLVPIGPPVPYDSELAPFVAAMPPSGLGEMTPEMLPAMRRARAGAFPPVTDDDLRRGGAYEISPRAVPGPAGADCYAGLAWTAAHAAELGIDPDRIIVWPGGFHGFTAMVPDAAVSKAAIAAPGAWLGRLLAGLG